MGFFKDTQAQEWECPTCQTLWSGYPQVDVCDTEGCLVGICPNCVGTKSAVSCECGGKYCLSHTHQLTDRGETVRLCIDCHQGARTCEKCTLKEADVIMEDERMMKWLCATCALPLLKPKTFSVGGQV